MGSASLRRAPPANSPCPHIPSNEKDFWWSYLPPNPDVDPDTSTPPTETEFSDTIVGGDSQRDSNNSQGPDPRRATRSEPCRAHLQHGVPIYSRTFPAFKFNPRMPHPHSLKWVLIRSSYTQVAQRCTANSVWKVTFRQPPGRPILTQIAIRIQSIASYQRKLSPALETPAHRAQIKGESDTSFPAHR